MSPLTQAIRVARQLMSDGRTGSDLANGLSAVASVLSPEQKKKLASRISREYMILGHAAHDPNLYRTCQAAKEAKEKSASPHLKVLTYKTPMCASCGLNRNGRCGLMGGILLDDPANVPEKAVHATADLMIANRDLDEGEARQIEMGREGSTHRVTTLHDRRIRASNYVKDDVVGDQMRSRRIAAILEPGESFDARPKRLTGPARKVNAEVMGLGMVDDNEDSDVESGVDFRSMFDDSMQVDIPSEPQKNRHSAAYMDSYTETDVPARERKTASVDNEVADEIQQAFFQVARKASQFLAEGVMTTRVASQLYQKMETLLENGAQHTRKTARLQRQIDALGGGMQI